MENMKATRIKLRNKPWKPLERNSGEGKGLQKGKTRGLVSLFESSFRILERNTGIILAKTGNKAADKLYHCA
jgi:hypothetical protein